MLYHSTRKSIFVEVLRTLAWKMFGSLVRSRRGTASTTHRTGHVDAVEQEEQFNRRSFSSGISTSDCLGRERKKKKKGKGRSGGGC